MKAIKHISAISGTLLGLLAVTSAYAKHPPGHGGGVNTGAVKAAGCTPATSSTEIDLNNVRALFTTSGLLWYNKPQGNPAYEVPKTPDRSGPNAIFAGGLWMGGLSPDNQLKMACILYREGNDFWPGPLTTTGDASVTDDVCALYDRFYTNERRDAERHDAYYKCLLDPDNCDVAEDFPDGYLIPSSYFDWPAINPTPNYDTYLAPFYDANQDGDYVPSDGDFPHFDLDQQVDCRLKFREDPIPLFGDKNIWWVFNDKGNTHTETGGQPIGMEIKAQAFAFSTNDEVNNMTFYNYVLINRGTQTLTNTYFGQWCDADLGCSDDDFTGCDVQRGLGYVYNWDDNDEGCNGNPGYGPQPPAIGIDFFEGPYQDYDNVDNPGPLTSNPDVPCAVARDQRGIPYKGIGIGYGDGIPDNERFGMRAFLYFSRDAASCCSDPGLAIHFYNYLRSIWKDGTPMSHGCATGNATGYEPGNPDAVRTYYMFPGDSDPLGWGTDCQPQCEWRETAQANPDRRFVQSAGPFVLEPGAYNNITVGVVWARATGGGAFASVNELRGADDKAQALFDNCFRILDGPDAPDVDIQELDRELILYLSNPTGSNNVNETYGLGTNAFDPTIPEYTVNTVVNQTIEPDPDNPDLVAPLDTGIVTTTYDIDSILNDRYYHFQGYKIYQVKDATVSVSELGDVNRARLLAVCDLEDGVDRIINYIQNDELGVSVATEMVNAPDTGVYHSLRVTEDLFATGDPKLVNYKTYYYITIAYSYNNYMDFNPDPNVLTGQAYPYLAGRKGAAGSIRSYAGIPHPPGSEAGGTVQNAQYGDEFEITRIEGQGNGGLTLGISQASEDQIVAGAPWNVDELRYQRGTGPVKVKVVDPLMVPNSQFELWFHDTTALPTPSNINTYAQLNDAYWTLVRLNGCNCSEDTVTADRAIEVGNEQIIPEWGISVTVDQVAYTLNNKFTEPLGVQYEFVPNADGSIIPWVFPIPDADGETAFNWIRSGTAADTALDYEDYDGVDDAELYEAAGGGWAPFGLVGTQALQPGSSAPDIQGIINGALISRTPSVLVVLTADKSKWTRCPVLEEQELPILAGGVEKLRMKTDLSKDKNGIDADDQNPPVPYNPGEGGLNGATGMSWFPGYAIELETGERLNMAFGEDSFFGSIGRDMIWNPDDQLTSSLGDPTMAGSHWIYIYNNQRRMNADNVQMPQYDEGAFLQTNLFDDPSLGRTRVWRSCCWVGGAFVPTGASLLPITQGLIPTTLKINLRVSKPYLTYVPYPSQPDPGGVVVDRNGGLGLYTFSTAGLQTETGVNSVEVDGLEDLGIVPNPYYAFSGYETSRLDNRVKFINLPRTCTISIYSVGGTLVRQFRKDNDLTYVDWDLKNAYNVPIAGGTYICHIDVPGAGEKVLKWFGVMRPVDLQNF